MYVDSNLVLMDNQALSGTTVTSNPYDYGSKTALGMFDVHLTVHSDGQVAGPSDVAVTVEVSDDGTTWRPAATHYYTLAEFNSGINSIQAPLKQGRYLRVKVESGDGSTAFSAGKVFVKLGGQGMPVRHAY